MHPIFFNIFSIPVHWFGVMMALGFAAGLLNWIYLGKKEGLDASYCSDLLFWIMISGVLGARIAYVASDLRYFLRDPITIFMINRGGLIYYGGFAGSCIAMFIFARTHRQKILALLDFVVTSVPLAHAFGRIGCFLNGCCHGGEHHGLFAVKFPRESLAWFSQFDAGRIGQYDDKTLPVHPVQLYESAFNLALYVVMVFAYRHRKRQGDVSALYLMAYPVGRFLLEFLRGDERMRLGEFEVAQMISVGLFIAGLVLLLSPRRRENQAASSSTINR